MQELWECDCTPRYALPERRADLLASAQCKNDKVDQIYVAGSLGSNSVSCGALARVSYL